MGATGYTEPNYRPVHVPEHEIPGATAAEPEGLQGTFTHPGKAAGPKLMIPKQQIFAHVPPGILFIGPHKDDPQAQHTGLTPHLQVMCGPMLRSVFLCSFLPLAHFNMFWPQI